MFKFNLCSCALLMGSSLIISPPSLARPYECNDIALGTNFTDTSQAVEQINYVNQKRIREHERSQASQQESAYTDAYNRDSESSSSGRSSGSSQANNISGSSSEKERRQDRGAQGQSKAGVNVYEVVNVEGDNNGSYRYKRDDVDRNSDFSDTSSGSTWDDSQVGHNSQNNNAQRTGRSSSSGGSRDYGFSDNSLERDTSSRRRTNNVREEVVMGKDCSQSNSLEHDLNMQKTRGQFENRYRQIDNHRSNNQRGRDSLNDFMNF